MEKVKRFVVFAGDKYYPAGGWDDHVGSFDTEAEARLVLKNAPDDWGHIIDLETGEEVSGDDE
jgi:hypothetical protein